VHKQDYELVANRFRTAYELYNRTFYGLSEAYMLGGKDAIEAIVAGLCLDFQKDNPLFDQKVFIRAALGEPTKADAVALGGVDDDRTRAKES
jgi:hypothetical protein